MAVDISQLITNNFPRTEVALIADTDIDYAQAKTDAIARAKRKAYGSATVPAEADIEDIVGEWVADQATILLIPVAKEHIAYTRNLQQSNRQGENINRYNLLRMLDKLKAELEVDCAEKWPLVEDLIGSSALPAAVPEVSVEGMPFDPVQRAWARGQI